MYTWFNTVKYLEHMLKKKKIENNRSALAASLWLATAPPPEKTCKIFLQNKNNNSLIP